MTDVFEPRGFPTAVAPFGEVQRFGPVSINLEIPERALAICAHPDDIEIGCGGTLAKWAASGCTIHHMVLTDGAKGSWDKDQNVASLVATRQEEQREAARRLGGGEVIFLGWPDGELRNTIREQWEVSRYIRQVRPGVVFSHDPWRRYRLHPDHRNAGFVVTDALVAARDPLFFADQELAPHRPTALLLFEADVANHVEDVAGFEEVKIQALLAHRSQYETTMGIASPGEDTTNPGFAAGIRQKLAEHGALAQLALGESFHRLEV
ncbi:MAG: PIG-L deacetylase family protein [Acidimicrobiales bacterium]